MKNTIEKDIYFKETHNDFFNKILYMLTLTIKIILWINKRIKTISSNR